MMVMWEPCIILKNLSVYFAKIEIRFAIPLLVFAFSTERN